MIRSLTLFAFLVLFAFAAPEAAAQYVYNGPGSRGPASIELGYAYPISGATFSYSATNYDVKTGLKTDTSYTEHITSKGGLGAIIGYSWALSKMGENSRLNISAALMYGITLWESGAFSYSSSTQGGTQSVGSGSVDFGVPIGLDYKFGADAMHDKSQRYCATFGAGVYPAFSFTVYKEQTGGGLRVLPYLKGEVGIFAGICMKIRAQYSFGSLKYIDYSSETNYGTSHTSLKGKSSFSLALVLMPFSWKWGRSQWWRERR